MTKELVVISGKGGTGKTSIVACFAALAQDKVMADCDVDAADLHLVLEPDVRQREDFSGGKTAIIDVDLCTCCGKCSELCRFDAISEEFVVDPVSCEGCGVCARFCPADAIRMEDDLSGQWFISETRHGPMVHARLGIGQENSGKLVTLVRTQAKQLAEERGLRLIIVDGSPGIGCPVIASVTGADVALIVTEPTLSGLHDMGRAIQLTEHFGIKTLVCVNKCDLNQQATREIKNHCERTGVRVVAEIPYDNVVTEAQLQAKSIVEYSNASVAQHMRELWERVADEVD